ncbi:MAG: hypothetical protein M3Q57_04700 [Pseudomonadota bacterium]|nr:hypothetical protein [Pseudomonadota bacterium]
MPAFASLSAASAAAALRVASLDLCSDEYLLLLARPDEIASISRLSHDPADSPLWRRARRFPDNRGNLESALSHRPTILLTMSGGGRATSLIARKLGVRAIRLDYPASVAEVDRTMLKVAAMLGDPRRANGWRKRLARLRAAPRPQRDTIFLTGGGDSLRASSLGAEWMRLAGLTQRPLPGGRASLETLALEPPTVLLRSSYRRAQPSLGQRWLDHPLIRRMPSRRIDADGRRWTCAGPLMLDEIERLRDLQ